MITWRVMPMGRTFARNVGHSSISGSMRWRDARLARSTVGWTASIGPGAWSMTNPMRLTPASVAPTCTPFMKTMRWAGWLGESASMMSRM